MLLPLRGSLHQTQPFGNDKEYHYFQVFREKLVPQLNGAFVAPIWDRIVLQQCHNEPFIRDAVIALAALTMSSMVAHSDSPTHTGHYECAFQQYDRALSDMRKVLANGDYSLRGLLIACLLVFCFESYQGNQDVAIAQATSGYKLLQTSTSGSRTKFQNTPLEDELVHTFSRLDLHVMTVLDIHGLEVHRIGKDEAADTVSAMPESFADLFEAQVYWEIVQRRAAHVIHLATSSITDGIGACVYHVTKSEEDNRTDFGPSLHSPFTTFALSSECRRQIMNHAQELWRWRTAFRALLVSLDSNTKSTAAVLEVNAAATQILLEALLAENECALDSFLPDFRTILSFTRTFLHDNTSRLLPVGYSIELCILPAMYVVVQMCRDKAIRGEILELLHSHPRREGIWDSRLIAAIGTWIKDVEEQGADGDFIPEYSRIRITKIRTDAKKKNAKVQCMKRVGKDDERMIVMETTINW